MADGPESDYTKTGRRIAVGGSALTGFLGVVLAINAVSSSNETGAGILLAASALAFGLLAIAVFRR